MSYGLEVYGPTGEKVFSSLDSHLLVHEMGTALFPTNDVLFQNPTPKKPYIWIASNGFFIAVPTGTSFFRMRSYSAGPILTNADGLYIGFRLMWIDIGLFYMEVPSVFPWTIQWVAFVTTD